MPGMPVPPALAMLGVHWYWHWLQLTVSQSLQARCARPAPMLAPACSHKHRIQLTIPQARVNQPAPPQHRFKTTAPRLCLQIAVCMTARAAGTYVCGSGSRDQWPALPVCYHSIHLLLFPTRPHDAAKQHEDPAASTWTLRAHSAALSKCKSSFLEAETGQRNLLHQYNDQLRCP